AGERVGLATAGEAQRRGVQDADQDVVDVVVAGVGAPERVRLGGRRHPAAAGAAQEREHGGFRGPAPPGGPVYSPLRAPPPAPPPPRAPPHGPAPRGGGNSPPP